MTKQTDKKAKRPLRRRRLSQCPYCGGEILFVEGVAHLASAVELDEKGGIHYAAFADPAPVGYHRLTWLECVDQCPDSREWSFEWELFHKDD